MKKFHFRDPYSYKLKRSVTILVVRYSAYRKLQIFRKVNGKLKKPLKTEDKEYAL